MFVELKGRVNKQGQLEFDVPANLPPGEVRITIEQIDPQAQAESDAKWDELFEKSQDLLTRMAREARAEHQAGSTEDFDPDEESL